MNKSVICNKKFFKDLPSKSIIEWNEENWNNNSICVPPCMDDHTALKILYDYLLPDGYCITYACSGEQANTEIVNYLIHLYSKKADIELKRLSKKKKLEEKKEQIDDRIKAL